MNKFPHKFSILVIPISIAIIIGGILLLDNYLNKDTIRIGYPKDSPVDMVGGGGERIYLKYGQIYALEDAPEKEYKIVVMTIHVTSERYGKMIFFNSPEQAEAAGFKKSEDFDKKYACLKEGKDWHECSGVKYIFSSTTDSISIE